MGDLIYYELIYFVSAIFCAILLPVNMALVSKWDKTPLKNRLTYGHIVKGFLLSLIPVYNTFVVCSIVWQDASNLISDLDNIKVFKEKNRD
jgi:hypothetical protein